MARWWIRRETREIICIVCLSTVLNDSMIQEDYVGMNEWDVLCCDNSSARERKRRRSNSSASYLFSNHVFVLFLIPSSLYIGTEEGGARQLHCCRNNEGTADLYRTYQVRIASIS
mmetsp:Transcript_8307/g.8898  ORF Transcript_8307/g.8898 Transcript_8307/m.8898 type:complete len:115 (-) Transcript_8307:105-449(-)